MKVLNKHFSLRSIRRLICQIRLGAKVIAVNSGHKKDNNVTTNRLK